MKHCFLSVLFQFYFNYAGAWIFFIASAARLDEEKKTKMLFHFCVFECVSLCVCAFANAVFNVVMLPSLRESTTLIKQNELDILKECLQVQHNLFPSL